MSRDRGIRVEVDPTGRLLKLEIADAETRMGGRALAQQAMDTVAQAGRQAATQVTALAEDAFGPGSALTEHVRQEAESRIVQIPQTRITYGR